MSEGTSEEAGMLEAEDMLTSEDLVRDTFQLLFPTSFLTLLPVHNHRVQTPGPALARLPVLWL